MEDSDQEWKRPQRNSTKIDRRVVINGMQSTQNTEFVVDIQVSDLTFEELEEFAY